MSMCDTCGRQMKRLKTVEWVQDYEATKRIVCRDCYRIFVPSFWHNLMLDLAWTFKGMWHGR